MAAPNQENIRALPFCQMCGDPLPAVKPLRLEAKAIRDPAQPNKTLMARVDIRVQCPNCRERIIVLQQYVTTYEIALTVVEEGNKKIKEEKNEPVSEAAGGNN